MILNRYPGNPVITPDPKIAWEKEAVFNVCVVEHDNHLRALYRAMSSPVEVSGCTLSVSTIGCAMSYDGVKFVNKKLFIKPTEEWEKFGCEDPRVVKLNGKYYIFYTALSEYPLTPQGIKVGMAITKDFKTIEKKSLITHFNAKAMTLFPDKINGKMAAILTANTDMPPAKIGIIYFNDEKELTDKNHWDKWYRTIDDHAFNLTRNDHDHVEIGAPPIKTERGWLLIYSYIKNYFSPHKIFGIEALLLDLNDPQKIIGRTDGPMLVPERDYEIYGKVANIVFPTGAIVKNGYLGVYYGGADTVICLATCKLDELLDLMSLKKKLSTPHLAGPSKFVRFPGNPLIAPNPEHEWEAKYTLNPGAIEIDSKIYLLYRAQGEDSVSTMGLAISSDGYKIDEKLDKPIYRPRIPEESAGCEDCRLVRMGETLYMTYTAYDGVNPAHIALSTLSVSDFSNRKWENWSLPKLLSIPEEFDKDSCIFEDKFFDKYAVIHRLGTQIWLDFSEDLNFGNGKWLKGEIILHPRPGKWDDEKIGLGPPPIKTEKGWLLLYHGISSEDHKYRMGAALLWLENPAFVIGRLDDPVLEPDMDYENNGLRPGTVFGQGVVVRGDELLMYYGGADQFVCGASISLSKLLKQFDIKAA